MFALGWAMVGDSVEKDSENRGQPSPVGWVKPNTCQLGETGTRSPLSMVTQFTMFALGWAMVGDSVEKDSENRGQPSPVGWVKPNTCQLGETGTRSPLSMVTQFTMFALGWAMVGDSVEKDSENRGQPSPVGWVKPNTCQLGETGTRSPLSMVTQFTMFALGWAMVGDAVEKDSENRGQPSPVGWVKPNTCQLGETGTRSPLSIVTQFTMFALGWAMVGDSVEKDSENRGQPSPVGWVKPNTCQLGETGTRSPLSIVTQFTMFALGWAMVGDSVEKDSENRGQPSPVGWVKPNTCQLGETGTRSPLSMVTQFTMFALGWAMVGDSVEKDSENRGQPSPVGWVKPNTCQLGETGTRSPLSMVTQFTMFALGWAMVGDSVEKDSENRGQPSPVGWVKPNTCQLGETGTRSPLSMVTQFTMFALGWAMVGDSVEKDSENRGQPSPVGWVKPNTCQLGETGTRSPLSMVTQFTMFALGWAMVGDSVEKDSENRGQPSPVGWVKPNTCQLGETGTRSPLSMVTQFTMFALGWAMVGDAVEKDSENRGQPSPVVDH
ncbi:hypothetical protein AP285_25150 [Limnospira platensis YZ]|nr:hypothetical protein AP285_25150 [Arthrospira platensis YZ]